MENTIYGQGIRGGWFFYFCINILFLSYMVLSNEFTHWYYHHYYYYSVIYFNIHNTYYILCAFRGIHL